MTMSVINPHTGLTEETFEPHPAEEVERRLAAAQQAFEQLRETTYAERAAWMRSTADTLEGDTETVAALITREMGKPIAQSRAEVDKSVRTMRYYADNAEAILADVPLEDPGTVGASRAFVRYQPLGPVLAVMPWNYPLWQVIRFAAPALMAGNTGVLKHASNVPASALYLDTLFTRGGFPEGAFTTLLIGSREVEAVIRDTRITAVTLTGSEPAGRAVAAAAGDAIKKTVLELGGSDPFLVMPSADLEAAATTAVKARTSNNGQSCIAGKRFIVHQDVAEEFTRLFTQKMAALRVGDPADEATEVGPLATEGGRDELAALVQDAVEHGATVLTGGSAPDLPGWYYSPTVLTDLPAEAKLTTEEAFGPVASVYVARDREEAVRIANQTRFGLSSALWTNDDEERDWLISRLEAGGVFVNGMTVSSPFLPFGGVKSSGYGRELAAEGIKEFVNVKTVWQA